MMIEQDKEVSYQEMRRRLYYRYNLISSLAADDNECARALRTFPDIDQIAVLHRIVGADGVWAAQQVLSNNQ